MSTLFTPRGKPGTLQTPDWRQARRRDLALLCALDRSELRLLLAPPVPAATSGVSGVNSSSGNAQPNAVASKRQGGGGSLGKALDLASFLPGRVGRWSRRLSLGLRAVRGLRNR